MTQETGATLSWERSDIERKFGFPAGKYTGVNNWFALGIGAMFGILFYASLFPIADTPFGQMFYERGIVPYAVTLLSGWSLAILLIKWRKLAFQRKAIKLAVVPSERDYVLSPITAERILETMREQVDDPAHFILLNRIDRTLSNLQNIGRVSDVDDILKSQADNDYNHTESTYTIVKGFTWAIPVLGFIGTVLGLSQAIGGFGDVLSRGAEMSQLKNSLQVVTSGLAVAFETTLVALVAALIIQLLSSTLKKKEDDFLDECDDYCHRNIVSRLRILPVDDDRIEEKR